MTAVSYHISTGSPTLMIYFRIYRMSGRSRGQDINYKRFIPSLDLKIFLKSKIRRPMPVEHIFSLCIPIPFHGLPKCRNAIYNICFCPKILPVYKKSLHKKGGFYKVAAIVLFSKRPCLGSIIKIPVRKSAMIGGYFFKEIQDLFQTLNCLRPCNPTPLNCNRKGGKTKT